MSCRSLILRSLFLLFSGFSLPVLAGVGGPLYLSNSGSAANPVLAVDPTGRMISVVWQDKASGNHEIYFRHSNDGGLTFSPPVNLSNSAYDSYWPELAADASGNISIVWMEANASGGAAVFYSRSTDFGASFTPPRDVSGAVPAFEVRQAIDSHGNISLLWDAWDSGSNCASLEFARSGDGGLTFARTQLAYGCWPYPIMPRLFIDRHDHINVVWVSDADGNDEIYFRRSTDDGVTFSPPVLVASGGVYDLKLAVNPSEDVAVAWADTGWSDYRSLDLAATFVRRSSDAGASFPFEVQLASSESWWIDLGVAPSGDFDTLSAGTEVRFAGGADFAVTAPISSSTPQSHGLLALDPLGNIHAVWSEGPWDAAQVFVRRSTDDGHTFAPPLKLSNGPVGAFLSEVRSDAAGDVYAIWTEYTSSWSDVVFGFVTQDSQSFLTVSNAPSSGGTVTSSPPGIACGPTCLASFAPGTAVTLTPSPAKDFVFSGWSGACSGNGDCTLTLDTDSSVTATFMPLYTTLTVQMAGTGGGKVFDLSDWGIGCFSQELVCNFTRGDWIGYGPITLFAAVDAGSTFVGWSGDCQPVANNGCQFFMDLDQSATATFNLIPTYSLNVALAGTGSGSVSSSPAGISCGDFCLATFNDASNVVLTASAAEASVFTGWSGDCSGTGACVVTMLSAHSVVAAFEPAPPPPPPPPADFSFASPPPPQTVSAGQSAHFLISIAAVNGFAGAVSFSCSGSMPAAASCSFDPPSVDGGSSSPSTSLTISTTPHLSAASTATAAGAALLFASSLPLLGLALSIPRRRSRRKLAALLLCLLVGFALLSGCGGVSASSGGGGPLSHGGTPAGAYDISVTASGSGVSHTMTVKLNVN